MCKAKQGGKMKLPRTKLKREMHQYKRRNQRFDARLNRIKRQYERVSQSPLCDDLGKQFGFVIRFSGGLLGGYITSYELMHLDSEAFKRKVYKRWEDVAA